LNRSTLNEIVNDQDVPFDVKVDAYDLLQIVLSSALDSSDMEEVRVTVLKMLISMGEDILEGDVAPGYTKIQVAATKKCFENTPDDVLFSMHSRVSDRDAMIMKAYNVLVNLSYVSKPLLYPYYTAKWAQFCLKSNVACKHVPSKCHVHVMGPFQ
jgi:uncharacterized protein (UPF0147 family)